MVQFEIPKNTKKIIAIDFDGTILHNRYPLLENPDEEIIDFIRRYRKKYIWILWTCREGERLQEAVDYMREEHGIKFDYVNENAKEVIEKFKNNPRKISADYYIDDRNTNIHSIF